MNHFRLDISQSFTGKFLLVSVEVAVADLPPQFENYTVVQLTDLHFGSITPEIHIEQALNIARDLNPDLLLFTGDFIQFTRHGERYPLLTRIAGGSLGTRMHHRRQPRQFSQALARLVEGFATQDNAIAVLGNHDFIEGHRTIMRYLSPHMHWLRNDSVVIRRGDSELYIAGVDDLKRGKPNLPKALERTPTVLSEEDSTQDSKQFFRILLSHNPDLVIDRSAPLLDSIDLMLCGHTHGGQVRMPVLGPVVTRTRQRRYVRGLRWFKNTAVYVSSGIGYSAIPLRFLCPPEVTVFRFVCDKKSSPATSESKSSSS